jgi:hypothetical protein
MTGADRNSVAAVMTVLVTVAMWLVGAMGVIGIPVLGIGLAASLSGGSTEISGIHALADGVTPGQLAIGLAGLAIMVPGVIFICLQLRRMLLTLTEGDPFVPENAARLSRIGIAVAAMELIRLAVSLGVSEALHSAHPLDLGRRPVRFVASVPGRHAAARRRKDDHMRNADT